MSELYFYATPRESDLTLTLDSGEILEGEPCVANDRDDAFRITLPHLVTTQGGFLRVTCSGYVPFEGRGIVGADAFLFDDIRLQPEPVVPEPPPRNPNLDPFATIQAVYEAGDFDLATKQGCGEYTEACVEALNAQQSPLWGHIRKQPAQNNWQFHAVDAIQLLAKSGETDSGIYDIILDTESPNAAPAWSYKGAADPNLWYYGPMPCPPA